MVQEANVTAQQSDVKTANLAARLLSLAVGLPIVLLVVFLEGPGSLALVPCAIGVLGSALIGEWEFFRAARLRGYHPSEWLGYSAILLIFYTVWATVRNGGGSTAQIPAFLPALFTFLLIGVVVHQVFRPRPGPLVNMGVTLLGVGYVGWLFSYILFLRSLPGTLTVPLPFVTLPPTARGAWLVLFVLAVTWGADAGAFFIGRQWGKTPLAPRLSPSKTRAGAIGGLVCGVLMALAWGTWIGLPPVHCLVLGLVMSVLGQMGDLCESALKRELGIKDFGTLLPGHGGMLDRYDSIFFTAPVAYYYLLFLVPIL